MNFDAKDGELILGEPLDAAEVARSWELLGQIPASCRVDASKVATSDGAGLAFLWSLSRLRNAEITGLRPEIAALLKPFETLPAEPAEAPERDQSLFAQIGRASCAIAKDVRDQVTFIGEFTATALLCMARPRLVRWCHSGQAWYFDIKANG
jgi:ABC-type transporter Mla MlaB component